MFERIVCAQGEAGDGDDLTPQAAEDLRSALRQYCDDVDPLAVLSIGALTLTKIRESQRIFKSLVLDARRCSNNNNTNTTAGGGGGGAKGYGGASVEDDALSGDQKQLVKELRACLLQRDNEIAILVHACVYILYNLRLFVA